MKEWTEENQREWDYLSAKGYDARDTREEMLYESLKARREVIYLQQKQEIRKSGLLYVPAIVVMVLGLGSCTLGAVSGELGVIVLGVILLFGSGLLNALNSWIQGVD